MWMELKKLAESLSFLSLLRDLVHPPSENEVVRQHGMFRGECLFLMQD